MVNITTFLKLPHATRLDFTVVLTVMIMYDIPPLILLDSLVLLLYGYVGKNEVLQIIQLPKFAMTAIVCILRNITKKERNEIRETTRLIKKPDESIDLADRDGLFTPTYIGSTGFNHLRTYKEYVSIDLHNTNRKFASLSERFSELEIEILEGLPDVPTFATRSVSLFVCLYIYSLCVYVLSVSTIQLTHYPFLSSRNHSRLSCVLSFYSYICHAYLHVYKRINSFLSHTHSMYNNILDHVQA